MPDDSSHPVTPGDPAVDVGGGAPAEEWVELADPITGARWTIDLGFVGSSWRCLWGAGCLGILDRPAPELGQGCCSVGAQLLDDTEARRIGALGASLDPARFEHSADAETSGVFADQGSGRRRATRVVDGACIFLNRPGFAGGEGCALHLAAIDEHESPLDWKPAVCWQLPLRVDVLPDGSRRLRRWTRQDWLGDGTPTDDTDGEPDSIAWCCTEDRTGADAYSGTEPVATTMAPELGALLGDEVAVELRRRVEGRAG